MDLRRYGKIPGRGRETGSPIFTGPFALLSIEFDGETSVSCQTDRTFLRNLPIDTHRNPVPCDMRLQSRKSIVYKTQAPLLC